MVEFLFLIGAVLGIAAYFIPALVAARRSHHNQGAILALNLFLGWTFFGWVIALVWALSRQSEERSTSEHESVRAEAAVGSAARFAISDKQRSRGSGAPGVAIGIVTILGLLFSVAVIGVMCRPDRTSTTAASSKLQPHASTVEIADWNWNVDPNFGTDGTIKWNVQVRNKSSRNVKSVRVEFTTFDAAGALVSTTFTYVHAIPAGGTRSDASYADLYGTETRAQVQIVDVTLAE